MSDPASRPPLSVRLGLWLIRAAGLLVPRAARAAWRREWEAEIDAHWRTRGGSASRTDVLRRVLGALPDAAWLRRQVTLDADLGRDARHAVRLLVRTPGVSLAAVLLLAVGIGAATAMFSVVDAVLLRPLPLAGADRLVTVWETDLRGDAMRVAVAPGNFLDWKARSTAFESLVGFEPYAVDFTDRGEPESVPTTLVTEGFLEMLGIAPLVGRSFTPDDYQPGSAPVVLVTHGYWQRRFGGDPALIGRALTLDGRAVTVVGILPPIELGLLRSSRQLGFYAPNVIEDHERVTRAGGWWQVLGRLRPGVTLDTARAEMSGIAAALGAEYPRTNRDKGVTLVPLRDHLVGGLRRALLVLLGAVGLVLVIACVNVASLLLARGLDRRAELGLRAALGASRVRLAAQLATESLVLAFVAGAAGLALARWAVTTVAALTPNDVPRLAAVAIDSRVVLFAAAVTVATALVCGVAPALHGSRRGVADAVRGGREAGAGPARRRARSLLVATEVAVALVLLAGAGVLVRSFARLIAVDPGFRKENVLALQVFAWDRPDVMAGFFASSLERMRALPGVVSAAAVSAMPFIEANIDMESTLLVENRPAPRPGEEPRVHVTLASDSYFETMRIPLRRGRTIDARDTARAAPVAVISGSLARRLWPDDEPLGDRVTVRLEGRARTVEIVGVVAEVRHDGLDRAPRDEIFLPHAQTPFGSMTFVIRTAGDPTATIDAAKAAIWSANPTQTIYDLATMDALVADSLRDRRLLLGLVAAFATVALLLTVMGIYAVTAFATRRRTHEIGVRMTFGARRSDILALVVRQGLAPVAAGLAAGTLGALWLTRSLDGLLFETTPADPLTLATVVATLAVVAAAACFVPALGATRIDPARALRAE